MNRVTGIGGIFSQAKELVAQRALVQLLRDEDCDVLDEVDDSDDGVFGWVIDPEGNKIELWQPPAGR